MDASTKARHEDALPAALHAALPAAVTGELGYLAPMRQRPYQYMFEPPPGTPWTNCETAWRQCRVHDARRVASSLSLDVTGFELLDTGAAAADVDEGQESIRRYCREVEDIALRLTGGMGATVFDHQLRQREAERPRLTFGRSGDGSRPAAVGRVHNDYTEASGSRRLRLALPDASPDHPFMILNFWRALRHPAIDTPLAVCDARSFSRADWLACDLRYPDRQGEIYLGLHSDAHRWYYFPAMSPHEVLVFKTFDSRIDQPARMTPHCAFDDPTAPADAPLRRSIEARCLVMLD
jgi:hypothetical protein